MRLPFSIGFAMALSACRDVGTLVSVQVDDSIESGQTQHTTGDTGNDSVDDSAVLAACIPDEERIEVTCPYTLPPDLPLMYNTNIPIIRIRTNWWIPFIRESSSSLEELLSSYSQSPSVAVGALTCCITSSVHVLHAWTWLSIGVVGPSEDGKTCKISIVNHLGEAGRARLDVDLTKRNWPLLECDVPIPWDVPSWLYSANSPQYFDLPANCHIPKFDLSNGQDARLNYIESMINVQIPSRVLEAQ